MITKYDMTSGEQVHQTRRQDTETAVTHTYEMPALALQLVAAETRSKPRIIPPDLATGSISDFLKQQY
ncbi:MAG: hypothetical protein GY814_11975 [Gammaproteobacteria bacterium]|nr:hypothetical protein [Gammaproteobacteria bacterium]